MKHIGQKHPYGCGPACLSMLTGIAYDDIVTEMGGVIEFTDNRGVTHVELDIFLAKHGYAVARLWRASYNVPWPPPPWTEAHLVIAEMSRGRSHCVVLLRDGTVLDPNHPQPTTMEDPRYISICQVAGVHKVA